MTQEEKARYELLRTNPRLVQELEDEAVEELLSKGYTTEKVKQLKINIHALIAPIIRKQFEGFYRE